MTAPVAYLVSHYPALSHTFIEREIAAVRDTGLEVHTFTVRPADPAHLVTDSMRAEAARTRALRGSTVGQWVRAAGRVGGRHPGAAAAGVATALRSGRADPRSKVWQAFYLAEATLLLHHLDGLGVRHVHAHFANVAADVARLVVALGRARDGGDAGWRWSFTMHGPTEFEEVSAFDLPAKATDADGICCISDFCRSQLMRMVAPTQWDKMRVVRMSVEADRYRPPANRAHADDAGVRLLSVGRLVPEKGSPVLLDAVTDLLARGVPVDLRLAGAGPLEGLLRETIARRGLGDAVTLLGPVGQDDLPDLYRWADLFVLPSFQEGLPVVLMEALATQLPVVTTQIAAVGELVADGRLGRVVPPGRADLLADALAELAADPDRREEMGRAGREAILAEFTPEHTGAAMRDFLDGVLPRV